MQDSQSGKQFRSVRVIISWNSSCAQPAPQAASFMEYSLDNADLLVCFPFILGLVDEPNSAALSLYGQGSPRRRSEHFISHGTLATNGHAQARNNTPHLFLDDFQLSFCLGYRFNIWLAYLISMGYSGTFLYFQYYDVVAI